MARAPIVIGTPQTTFSNTDAASLTFSYTVTAGTGRVLIVAAGAVDGVEADTVATGVTYGGTAMTLVNSNTNPSGANDIGASLWILNNPAVGAANIVVTYTGTCFGTVAIGCEFQNVDPVTQQDVAATGGTSESTPTTVSLVSVTDGALGVDLVLTRQAKTHAVGAAPQALLGSQVQSTGGDDCTLSMSTELMATAGSIEMTRSWTTNTDACFSMMVLRPRKRRISIAS